MLVAASFGGEIDEDNQPNSSPRGVKDLRRKFEDNEADIITDLYARHFKSKPEEEEEQNENVKERVTGTSHMDSAQ